MHFLLLHTLIISVYLDHTLGPTQTEPTSNPRRLELLLHLQSSGRGVHDDDE